MFISDLLRVYEVHSLPRDDVILRIIRKSQSVSRDNYYYNSLNTKLHMIVFDDGVAEVFYMQHNDNTHTILLTRQWFVSSQTQRCRECEPWLRYWKYIRGRNTQRTERGGEESWRRER